MRKNLFIFFNVCCRGVVIDFLRPDRTADQDRSRAERNNSSLYHRRRFTGGTAFKQLNDVLS